MFHHLEIRVHNCSCTLTYYTYLHLRVHLYNFTHHYLFPPLNCTCSLVLIEKIPTGNVKKYGMPGEMTVEHVSTRSVQLRTMWHEKYHFTVVLGAMANGQKLKPFIFLRCICPIPKVDWILGVVAVTSALIGTKVQSIYTNYIHYVCNYTTIRFVTHACLPPSQRGH